MKTYISVFSLAAVLSTSCGPQPEEGSALHEEATGDNQPHWFGLEAKVYDQVAIEGHLETMPWPDHYWATYQGGIGYRWQTMKMEEEATDENSDYKKFIYEIPSPEQVAAMSEDELNQLSPAEKYDIWRGVKDLRKSKSATAWQRKLVTDIASFNLENFKDDKVPYWAGICNGWSLAAIAETEPKHGVVVELKDGRKMTFFVTDIKALLSQIYNDFQEDIYVKRLGNRCEDMKLKSKDGTKDGEKILEEVEGRVADENCRDVNPMTLHLALDGYLAQNKAFVVDVDPGEEVWNQPAYGYKMKISEAVPVPMPSSVQARSTKFTANVSVEFLYVDEADPIKESIVGTDQAAKYVAPKKYEYVLELNSKKEVIGGEWKSQSSRPDFIWTTDERPSQEYFDESYPLNVRAITKLHKWSLAD